MPIDWNGSAQPANPQDCSDSKTKYVLTEDEQSLHDHNDVNHGLIMPFGNAVSVHSIQSVSSIAPS